MLDIVKFENDAGLQIQVTSDDVRNYFCPNATEKEVGLFLALCQSQRLNPWTRDVYLIKYGSSPATMVTGKDAFLKRAESNPNYEGFEAGVTFIDKDGKVQRREGSSVFKLAGEQLVGGWCRVFVKGKKPFYDEVTLDEYQVMKKDRDGKEVPNATWSKMGATMVRKVAIVHALREAFNMSGMYVLEEMGKVSTEQLPTEPVERVEVETVETITEPVEVVVETGEIVEEVVEEPATQKQIQALFAVCKRLSELRDVKLSEAQAAVYNSQAMKNQGHDGTGRNLTKKQASVAIDQATIWIEKAESEQASESGLAQEDIPF